MRKRYVNHSVSIDVDIIEFDDDAIVDACVDRGLVDAVLKESGRVNKDEKMPTKPRDIAADVLSHLMCKRASVARAEIDRLIAAFVPAEILAAREAIAAGDTSLAICELEHYVSPSLAATIDDVNYGQLLHAAKREQEKAKP